MMADIKLRKSFLPLHKRASEAYTELRKYMERIRDQRVE